jgi:acyl carrier protein
MMELLKQVVAAVFPDADVSRLSETTRMEEIPGWDSMNAVNLLAQIEAQTGRTGLALAFSNTLTIAEIIESLRAQGVAA